MERPEYLNPQQKEALLAWLSGPPVSLAPEYNAADFPRELDVFVHNLVHLEVRRKWSWSGQLLREGRAFELAAASNMVLRALLAGHDPHGIFGPPVRQAAVDPNSLRLAYHDYLAFLMELRDLVHSLEAGLQLACNKLELANYGPVARRCGCDLCQVPLGVLQGL